MSLSDVFEWAADALDRHSQLSRNEARGIIRLALKEAGIEPKLVNKSQMLVVVQKLLARVLVRVRVEDATEVCRRIADDLKTAELASPILHTPEDIFSRLGRR